MSLWKIRKLFCFFVFQKFFCECMSSQQLLNQLFCKVKIRPICLWKCIIKQEIYIVLKSCVPSRSKVSNWPKSLFGLNHSIYHCLFGTPYYVGRYFWGIMFIHFFVRKHLYIMQLNSFYFLILYKCRIIWFYTSNNESIFWPEFFDRHLIKWYIQILLKRQLY